MIVLPSDEAFLPTRKLVQADVSKGNETAIIMAERPATSSLKDRFAERPLTVFAERFVIINGGFGVHLFGYSFSLKLFHKLCGST